MSLQDGRTHLSMRRVPAKLCLHVSEIVVAYRPRPGEGGTGRGGA